MNPKARRARWFQWGVATLILFAMAGGYFWYQSKASTTINAPIKNDLSQSLLGYWKMDEGTGTSTTADSSGNAVTLTMTAIDSGDWQTGQIGPFMLDLDGSAEWLTATDPAVLDFVNGASFSIAGWFNRDTENTVDTLVAKRNGTANTDDGYMVYIGTDDLLYFEASEISGTDERQVVSTSTFATTGWHHFVVSWEDDRDVSLYIDGASQGTVSGSTFANVASLVTALDFKIGAESDNGNPFDGKLDDIRVYGYPLSADDVTKLYQTTAPAQPVDTGLVGHWTFDGADIAGTTAVDRSGKGNNGTLSLATKTIGKVGQGVYIDDPSSTGAVYLTPNTDNSLELGTGDRTIAGWIKLVGSPLGYSYFLFAKGGEGTEGYNFQFGGDGEVLSVNVYTESSGGTYFSVGCPSLFNTGWRHVAAVIDRDAGVFLYLDGVLLARVNTSVYNGVDVTNTGQEAVLAAAGFNPIGFDDVRIYNRTLSASEVYQLYTSGNATVNAPLEDSLSQSILGYWKLDEGTGTSTTADASGNSNTLSQVGPPTWTTGAIGPYAMDFSGSGQYLTIASPSSILDFPTGASFSLTGWFNRDLFVNDHTILSNVAAQGDDGYIVWIDGDDSLYFRADDNADANYRQLVSATKFTATGWHHFAVSWEDDRDADLYIDGALDASTKTGTFASVDDLTNANAFRLGAETDAGNPFDGKLDDIRVYGYPLSAGDVSKLYQTTAPAQPVDTGLVGHWTFDGADIQGTTVIDRSGKGNNGTATGTTKTIGKLGQGLSFNGTSDYIYIGPHLTEQTVYTVSLWFFYQNGATGTLINRGDTNFCSYNPRFEVSAGVLTARESTCNGAGIYGTQSLTTGWHHVAGVRNDQTAVMYYDGIALTPDTSQSTGNFMNSQTNIGATNFDGSSPANFFNDKIDDVRLYNRALTATEVADLYRMGV
jgi:hypothetical protein